MSKIMNNNEEEEVFTDKKHLEESEISDKDKDINSSKDIDYTLDIDESKLLLDNSIEYLQNEEVIYQDEMEEKKFSDKKKFSNAKKIGISLLSLLLVAVITITCGYYYVRSKIYTYNEPVSKEEVVIKKQEKDEFKEVQGITNILLIGADGRGGDDTPKSDSIIIATLDNNNNKIKLTSLYRDTLVNIPGYGQQRINASYELGGVKLLSDTIKQTYDIKIDKHITIDFKGFEAIIDQIGGVEVDVKDYQLKELNNYIGEATGGNDCPVTKTGIQTLNGKQALSYSRIRKGVGDDYERTERQREVLFQVVEKLKTTNPTKYLSLMKSMLNYIDINFEPIEALNMAYTIYKFPNLVTEQMSI
ncbi:MAG: LCP family protein, partial [Clostridium sp.]